MKENTVLLNIDDYNRLRDFYKGIDDGKFVYVDTYFGKVYYYTEKEIDTFLKEETNAKNKEINDLREVNRKLSEDIKYMNFWQLLKFWYNL